MAVCHARYVRYPPRKVERVLDAIRGRSAEKAYKTLMLDRHVCRTAVMKALKSAVASVKGTAELHDLKVTKAFVCQGPVIKRMIPKAMGRAATFTHKTCHITIEVDRYHKQQGTYGRKTTN